MHTTQLYLHTKLIVGTIYHLVTQSLELYWTQTQSSGNLGKTTMLGKNRIFGCSVWVFWSLQATHCEDAHALSLAYNGWSDFKTIPEVSGISSGLNGLIVQAYNLIHFLKFQSARLNRIELSLSSIVRMDFEQRHSSQKLPTGKRDSNYTITLFYGILSDKCHLIHVINISV